MLRRTIIAKPAGNGPFPAVVLLGDIGCYTLDVTLLDRSAALRGWSGSR